MITLVELFLEAVVLAAPWMAAVSVLAASDLKWTCATAWDVKKPLIGGVAF